MAAQNCGALFTPVDPGLWTLVLQPDGSGEAPYTVQIDNY